jgi:ubiquinone/menaquinone biosynthesis C-methylase UbiE
VVSPSWSDDAHRDHDEEVPQIAARLGIREGMTVADIGAGSGYDTVRLARWVGAKGRVVAEDVTPAYLTLLKGAVAKAGIGNVEIKLGAEGDPGLAPRSIDRAIMIHMYHEIRAPYALLAHLAPAFRAHGLLGIEELDRPTVRHGTPPALLRCELSASGYQLQALSPLKGSLGYFAVFSPPKPGWRPGSAVRCTG